MDDAEYRKAELATKQWTVIIGVQMHFNDMIQKLRQLAATVVTALYGFSLTVDFGNNTWSLTATAGFFTAHFRQLTSIALVLLGFIFLLVAYLIDRHYYFQMLIAAVKEGEAIENEPALYAKLTGAISKSVSIRQAETSLQLFYFVSLLPGVVLFLTYAARMYFEF